MTGASVPPPMPTPPLSAGLGTVPWEEVFGGHTNHLWGGLASPAVTFEMPGVLCIRSRSCLADGALNAVHTHIYKDPCRQSSDAP